MTNPEDEGEEWKRTRERDGDTETGPRVSARLRSEDKRPIREWRDIEAEWTTKAGLLARVCRYTMPGYAEYLKICEKVEAEVREQFGDLYRGHGPILGEFWRCGYVRIPAKHPAYLLHYTAETAPDVDVHGGITCSIRDTEEAWWVGFDCCHYDDTEAKWPLPRVQRECERLARQLQQLGKAVQG